MGGKGGRLEPDNLCQSGTSLDSHCEKTTTKVGSLLRFDGRLVDQHDGNVVSDRIESSALIAFQTFTFFRQWGFTDRADQNLKKSFVDHRTILLPSSRFRLNSFPIKTFESVSNLLKTRPSLQRGFGLKAEL